MLLRDKTRQFSSPKFRKWIELETAKQSIAKTTEGVEFPQKVLDYLFVAYGKKPKEGSWQDTVLSLKETLGLFSVDVHIPIMKNIPKGDKESDWEYSGRMWAYLSHILAQAYGWSLEYISNLDVNEAFAHIQEILTDRHLDQEFLYGLSEIAYPFNKATKRSEFKPMPRPYWMRPIPKPIKRVKVKRSFLPVGNVIDSSGLGAELGGWNEIIKNETKETNTSRNPRALPSS